MGNTPCKIGLLGGSFNPAHEGHVYISEKALEILGLDEVWWLVSPQNPLKSPEGMAPFAERFEGAERLVADFPAIKVSDVESRLGTQYTYDTLKTLTRGQPERAFVWLMGADNLAQISQWHNWKEIFELVPVAVFNRETSEADPMACEAAQHFASGKIDTQLHMLAQKKPPAWCFVNISPHSASSTAIRKNYKKL